MREAANQGACIDLLDNAPIGLNKEFEIGDYAKTSYEVGPQSYILSSDLGQVGNPLPEANARRDILRGPRQRNIDLPSAGNNSSGVGIIKATAGNPQKVVS